MPEGESLSPQEEIFELSEDDAPLNVGIGYRDASLFVNGKSLDASVNPRILKRALTEGKSDILSRLERLRKLTKATNPKAEVTLPPFIAVHLGGTYQEVLSSEAQAEAKEHSQQLFTSRNALRGDLAPLWDAVVDSGYTPQVRAFGRNHWIELWAELPQESQQTDDSTTPE